MYWAVGPTTTDDEVNDIIGQMRELGASQAQIDAYIRENTQHECEVLKENEVAVKWFLDVDDQFLRDGCVLLGLNVQAIQADAQMLQRKANPDDYKKLRYLGRRAAYEFNKGQKWR